MSYKREPINRNPGFPPRSPSPPQFPQYSLWGNSFNSCNFGTCTDMHAPARPTQRHNYPSRADDGPRPSPRIQGVDRPAWTPFTPDRKEQRSMTFWSPEEYKRSSNQSIQFTKEQPQRNQPQLWHNVSQYDEQRVSVSPQRLDEYCMPFQPAMRFNEESRPSMRPRFLSPTGRSNKYCQPPFQPSGQYDRDAHQFLMQTKPPQQQFPSQRSDEHIRSPFPAYNSFMRCDGDQPLMPRSQSYRLQSPLHRHEHARSPFEASKRHGNFRDYDEEVQPLPMPQTPSFRLRSPLQRPDEQRDSWSQYQPSEQPYNSIHHSEDLSGARLLPESQLQSNTLVAEEVPKILIPCKQMSNEETEDIVIEEPQPVMVEDEPEVVVVERFSLYLHPDNFQFGESSLDEIDHPSLEPQEQASTSSCSSGEWTRNIFNREGDPSSQSHSSSILSSRVQSRRQRTSTFNKKLVKALSQPVILEKGAKMMQRMGWVGGGLGKDGSGIVDPIAPNAIYATTTKGFGQEVLTIQRLPTKREKSSPCLKRNKNKKMQRNAFNINVLLNILKFAINDMQLELFFEELLQSSERKRIHRIVEAIGNKESNLQFGEHIRIVKDIRKRCLFKLKTQSDGEGKQRKICVYKEAPDNIFLVTPDDCRPCITDIVVVEDEPNPFLKSIKKHGHNSEESTSTSPAPSDLINKLVEFFLEFCEDEAYKEFRFLGPFKKEEIIVINNFFTLIEDLSNKKKPTYSIPLELLEPFSGDKAFQTNKNPNGFASIKKYSVKKENKKVVAEERDEELSGSHPINHRPESFTCETIELLSDDEH